MQFAVFHVDHVTLTRPQLWLVTIMVTGGIKRIRPKTRLRVDDVLLESRSKVSRPVSDSWKPPVAKENLYSSL